MNDIDLDDVVSGKDKKLIRDVLGLSSVAAFTRYTGGAVAGLLKFGNEFEKSLGHLLFAADFKNSIRILNVWQKECVEYEMLWRIYQAKERAKKE